MPLHTPASPLLQQITCSCRGLRLADSHVRSPEWQGLPTDAQLCFQQALQMLDVNC